MKQRESRISRAIMTALRARGHFCFKVHGSEYMMAGLPDIIVCADGFYIGLETKTPEDRDNVSTIQKLRHEQIASAGGVAVVVCGPDEAVRVVDRILTEHQSTPRRARP